MKSIIRRLRNWGSAHKQQPTPTAPHTFAYRVARAALLRKYAHTAMRYFDIIPLDVCKPVPAFYKALLQDILQCAKESAWLDGFAAGENKFSTAEAFAQRKRERCWAWHTHFIPESCGCFASAKDKKYRLLTSNISYCVAITFYNPRTQQGCLVHFASRNSLFLSNYLEDPANTTLPNIQRVICKLLAPSQPISELRCTLTSGEPAHISFYKVLLMAFGIHLIECFCYSVWCTGRTVFSEKYEGTVQLNCKTGVVSHPSFWSVRRHTLGLFPPTKEVSDVYLDA